MRLFLRKFRWLTIISLLVILSSCSSASKEAQAYFDDTYDDITEDSAEIERGIEEYVNHIIDEEPEKAVKTLNDKVIPEQEALIEKINDVDLNEEDLIEFNQLAKSVVETNLDKHQLIKNMLEEIMESIDAGNMEDLDLDTQLEKLSDMNEEHVKEIKNYAEMTDQIVEEYDDLEYEDTDSLQEEQLDSLDASELDEEYDQLIAAFVESLDDSSAEGVAVQADEDLMQDQGNVSVVLDGEVSIDDTFHLTGKSNLPEGATVQLQTYHYGSENPNIKEKIEVDPDGSFEWEIDVEEDELNGEPIKVRVAYLPNSSENSELQGIYGEEGEKLEGPFVHKYTDIKRTRQGAFAYAYLELNADTTAPLETTEWNAPDDYGDFNVWMEEESIEIHDGYYDVTMHSNLSELTKIKVSIEVGDQIIGSYVSEATVMPDGSFRMMVPRPDISDSEVNIVIEASSGASIETEELYGEHGEKFEGDLVKETKKGKDIEYKFNVGENADEQD